MSDHPVRRELPTARVDIAGDGHPAYGDEVGACPVRRRTVLAGACMSFVGAAAGCAGSDGTAGSAEDAGSGQSVQDAGRLGKLADIPVGGGTVFTQQAIVVTQPSAGELHAFSAVCTHQGCLVNQVTGETINCPCHGSKFSVVDASVVQGPAQSPLEGRSVVVDGDDVRLA